MTDWADEIARAIGISGDMDNQVALALRKEFERGVRWAFEQQEHYNQGTSNNPALQFGEYTFGLKYHAGADLSPESAAHLERRIQAYLTLAPDKP